MGSSKSCFKCDQLKAELKERDTVIKYREDSIKDLRKNLDQMQFELDRAVVNRTAVENERDELKKKLGAGNG